MRAGATTLGPFAVHAAFEARRDTGMNAKRAGPDVRPTQPVRVTLDAANLRGIGSFCWPSGLQDYFAAKSSMVSPSARVTMAFFQARVLPIW